mmetsp:Transcript_16748/g.35158  ORF Transcript_16748/g.35158 Transcript_16748/m.35158 type:complete len:126 (-) Transcript_16748:221-598(-)
MSYVKKELETLLDINDRNETYKLSAISTEKQLKQRMAETSNQNSMFDASDESKMDQEIASWEQAYGTFSLANAFIPKKHFRKMRKFAGPTFDRKLEDYSSEFVRSKSTPDGHGDYARKILYMRYV